MCVHDNSRAARINKSFNRLSTARGHVHTALVRFFLGGERADDARFRIVGLS